MPIKADKSLRAYYNEIDPFAAQWIRNLMAEGWITKGDVDDRSIEDVQPNDIAGYDRLHFFAGVAVWDYALNQAGWGRGEIWTGSCPCQPFSAAGKGAGFDDERHLWPAFHHLIQECRPPVVLGEQVASKNAEPWIDLVHTDLEAMGYDVGAVAFPAACVGAPHIRDRLYWVADARQHSGGSQATTADHGQSKAARPADWAGGCGGSLGGMANHDSNGCQPGREGCAPMGHGQAAGADCGAVGVADTPDQRQHGWGASEASDGRAPARVEPERLCDAGRPGPVNGFWSDADWLFCRDGKWRPVEPGTFPLANGAPARVGRLRAYGNAIVAPQAQAFIEAVMSCKP